MQEMHILLVTQYFWPESFIINDLTERLAAHGHTVTVLTGKPNYPDGKIYPGYKQTGIQIEDLRSGIKVIRVPLRPRSSGGARNLALNYASFVWSGLIRFPMLVRGMKIDAVLVFAPSPITATIPAIPLKWWKRAPLVLWVQDLWPESLAATGFVKNRAVLFVTGALVRLIYACCDKLLIQSEAFRKPMLRYTSEKKLVYYPNSVMDPVDSSVEAASVAPEWVLPILEDHFSVVFAGNIGSAQSIGTILGAAEQLADIHDLRIVLVGSGSMSAWVENECRRRSLENVVLTGRFPMSVMPLIFSKASVLLVTLKDSEIFSHTIPSKIQAYLAAGKPIVAALNGEGARIISEAGAGVTCAAEDVHGLASKVRLLHGMSNEERMRMGASGRRYFLDNFDMNMMAHRLAEILKDTR